MPRASAVKKTVSKEKKEKSSVKRPMSAFFWYLAKRRASLLNEKPELKTNVREVGRIVGVEWKAMSTEQRKPYVKLQEDDKKRYDNEKAKEDKKDDKGKAAKKE
eukprot:Gregarina_sp_Pseudo_9__3568@NODE_372_length_3017_cov_54_217596_g351_i0_p3_GENE_NODE_372_length_3017_cov_54_217596_g351_i0NODE_372_length_3017_cov_54_217596_g351_i0_p3_ORF_typecomplete_len104_score31_58HMG_box/PF00505_19/1_4e04HMG_box/PF00505_19/6_9e18HMG_box_2/PF09011_10/2_8e03HMG_box_2/PF09011_10/1_3e14HMG_box_2/PF09011_10/5_2e02RIB43A/PF05914_12/0_00035HMG_box_5/PF14887_6/0_0081Protamine_like/PF06382_11/3_NODE_372_length_3017_cov_54_217596_g351_i025352846